MLIVTQADVLGVQQSALYSDGMLPSEWLPQHLQVPQPLTGAQHSTEGAPDFALLLHQTLPRLHITPADVPAAFQEQVRKRLHDYSLSHRDVQEILRRASGYLPMIRMVLKQHNLPGYFAFLPLAESAFEVRALHPDSGARGLWQLMPDTARSYGLRVSDHLDERLDAFRATRAAARYLRELHDIFGDDSPLLVLAAYNYGENNVAKAIVRARTRDIWSLLRKRQIPYQTRDFLVKMVALWVLVTHPQRFQLSLETAALPKAFSEITFPHAVPLATIAQHFSMPVEQLQDMNPHLLAASVPAHAPVRIPPASVDKYTNVEVRLQPPAAAAGCCAQLVVEACRHTVVAGESLSAIAQQYNIGVATLKLLNQLEGANPVIRPGQQLATCEALSRFVLAPDLW
jgi:membrane-bound lytic murein transglycosylase D